MKGIFMLATLPLAIKRMCILPFLRFEDEVNVRGEGPPDVGGTEEATFISSRTFGPADIRYDQDDTALLFLCLCQTQTRASRTRKKKRY